MSKKLHIPGPADEEDLTELNMVIVLAWAVCMIVCIGLFLFFRERIPESARLPATSQAAAAEEDAPKTELEKTVEIFRFGPRDAAEQACLKLRPQLASGELPQAIDDEWIKVLGRGATYAPLSCLMGAYLKDEVSAELQTHTALANFWRQAQTFEVSPELTALMLKRFYLSETTPQTPEFSRWLRLCGMSPAFRARPACTQLMRRSAPAQGRDVLEMVEKHLEITASETLAQDMPKVAEGLGNFSADGQPGTWKIEQTETIEDYNHALRIGAAFMLCRIVNTPDDAAARAAALGLSKAANMSARVADKKLVRRWRETCQLVFKRDDKPTQKQEEAPTDTPPEDTPSQPRTLEQRIDKSTPTPTGSHLLAVWDGQEGSRPDYTLKSAVERGVCPKVEGYPAWYCSLSYWQGDPAKSFNLNMQSLFAKTSYIEWLDD